jgi:general secretion pathway protein I
LCRAARSESAGATAGFTLIEVLVAIAVVAVVMSSIGALTATTTRGVGSLEQHVVLMETARSVAAGLPPRAQLAPGELTGELYGNRWRVGISPLVSNAFPPVDEAPWAPERVTIRVQAPSGAVFTLETVRLAQRRRQ